MTRFVLSVIVQNHAGVLSRVSGLFSRRGFNIDSLTVCETNIPGESRMTIVVNGDEYVLEQIEKQLSKLVEVISIKHIHSATSCQREMALIKVKSDASNRASIIETCSIFKARILDVGLTSIVIELTGKEEKIESFIKLMEPFGILEYVKTGLTALERGDVVMTDSAEK